jgi:hypothetical protein
VASKKIITMFYSLNLAHKIEKNEMDVAYSLDGGGERRVQCFGGKT